MMKLIYSIVFLAMLNLHAQTTFVPDNNFEQALIDIGYDDILDDYVKTTNINKVTNLNIDSKGISDLTGIQDFIALKWLWCSSNQLQGIDVSHNKALTILSCFSNELTVLDVSKNSKLKGLWCSNNQLVSLDLRNGNNSAILNFDLRLTSNPNLNCILVDNAVWSTANWTFHDKQSIFIENDEACNTKNAEDKKKDKMPKDVESLAKGKALFSSKACTACHLEDGGGLIGPNLTDNKWILGGGEKNIYNTIYYGGRPGKGMIPWGESALTDEEIKLLTNYIISIQGTSPKNPKEAEGDIVWPKK